MKCMLKQIRQHALLLREKEDIEDSHERHQLVPPCRQKPQKSPACLHCRDLTTHMEGEGEHRQTCATQWFTNLELSQSSRAVTAGSVGLSKPHIPKLCLISPHSGLAGGGNGLKERKKQWIY